MVVRQLLDPYFHFEVQALYETAMAKKIYEYAGADGQPVKLYAAANRGGWV
jgi:hypothetical protein